MSGNPINFHGVAKALPPSSRNDNFLLSEFHYHYSSTLEFVLVVYLDEIMPAFDEFYDVPRLEFRRSSLILHAQLGVPLSN